MADALSRVETNALLSGMPPVLDFDAMAMAQKDDRQIHALQSSPSSSLQIEPMPLLPSGSSILCDTHLAHWFHYLGDVPFSTPFTLFHIQEFELLSDSSHLGMYGPESTQMYVDGLTHTSNVNVPKYIVTQSALYIPFQNQIPDSTEYTSTL